MSEYKSVEILGIIQKNGTKSTRCYDTSYKPFPESVVGLSADNNLVIACNLITDRIQTFFVDLLSFELNYRVDISVLNTWDELKEQIEMYVYDPSFYQVLVYTSVPSMQWFKTQDGTKVYSAPTRFKSNMFDRPFMYSLNYTNYVEAAYTNINFSNIRNESNRRKSLPDLVFTKVKGRDINLENTLVSVNGIVGLPVYDKNKKELYVKNGANMLRDAHYTDQNIVFLDFTKLFPNSSSTLKTHKFFECYPELYFEETTPDYVEEDDRGSNWAYKIDKSVYLTSITGSITDTETKMATLKHTLETFLDRRIDYQRQVNFVICFNVEISDNTYEHIPLLCIGGRLFFPGVDDITYTTVRENGKKYLRIVYKTSIDLLERILASNLQHNGVFYGLASLYRISIGYIISNMFTNKEYNAKFSSDEWKIITHTSKLDIPFVSIIETDKHVSMDVVEQFITTNEKTINFPKTAQGILINRKTREIVDYTAQKKQDSVDTSITPQPPLFISNLEGDTKKEDEENKITHVSPNEIPDAARYDRFTWEKETFFYKDNYNKIEVGELLKDIHSFIMLNILCASKTPIKLFEGQKELPEEVEPVYTTEYEPFKWPLKHKKSTKIFVSMKDRYNEIGGIKYYHAFVSGLPEEYRMYESVSVEKSVYDEFIGDYRTVTEQNPLAYEYNSNRNCWICQQEDNSENIITYNSTKHAWYLKHIANGTTTKILKTIETDISDAPYRAGLVWYIYNGEDDDDPYDGD